MNFSEIVTGTGNNTSGTNRMLPNPPKPKPEPKKDKAHPITADRFSR